MKPMPGANTAKVLGGGETLLASGAPREREEKRKKLTLRADVGGKDLPVQATRLRTETVTTSRENDLFTDRNTHRRIKCQGTY